MSILVYSALYGDYDTVKPAPEGATAVMFTDDPTLARTHADYGWTFRHIPYPPGMPQPSSTKGARDLVMPMLRHKYWKTHPGQVHLATPPEVAIWIDASITTEPGFVDKALAALGDDDWSMVKHPWRDCIYDEAQFSAILPRYASMVDHLQAQAKWYRSLGHPEHGGLPATGVSVRRLTRSVRIMSAQWWDECVNWSHQDQVSLPVLRRIWTEDPPGGYDPIRFNDNLGWTEGWGLWPHLK